MRLKIFLKRVKLKLFLSQYRNEERSEEREERHNSIVSLKTNLLKDLMTGHNIGDFTMNESDFDLVRKMTYRTPMIQIRFYHKKYRGVTRN